MGRIGFRSARSSVGVMAGSLCPPPLARLSTPPEGAGRSSTVSLLRVPLPPLHVTDT